MSAPDADAPDVEAFGDYLVSSRDAEEYRAMFALSDADLAGGVLDCPGGGSSFTATARAAGVDARAVDPVYALPVDDLAAQLREELERGRAWMTARSDAYRWDDHGDPEVLTRRRAASAAAFVAHRRAEPDRYVAASLPQLPMADGEVDLVLSSHLLFTYADRLDAAAHLAVLREMLRVARRQVRVYPLLDASGHALPDLLAGVVADLRRDGVRARVQAVAHEFQRGAGRMLVLER
ncbi:methyltransferase domain-containing protein [uncultured Pseudokineococcus sp.]|uniref:methyltransferase domain-containing protein n=1 Tax=uncultured Pseudokineococcus sp. TaxID=1642928 RepID=UPI00262FD586|nr:methyltransferase domain-containing protein [uncultured Pseudokineococcus sp.]